MKIHSKFLTLLAAAALFAAGCVDEDPAYLDEKEKPVPADGHGYLAATNLSMRVILDTETETGDDDTGGDTQRPASRAADDGIDTDAYLIELLNARGEAVLQTTYGELKTVLAEPMALEVGSYTLNVRSEADSPAAEWEHPVYGCTKTIQVTKADTKENPVQIGEVVCTLQNIKVTVKLSVDLAGKLTENSEATVSLGPNSLVFPIVGGKAGYFMPLAPTNTLDFVLAGSFADTPDEGVTFSKTIANVKAGQWRKITLVIAYADKGGIRLDIQVDSFVQDETVVVDGTQGSWEEIYQEDPLIDPPTIVWKDHDLTKPFQLKASMFDANDKCTEPFDFELTAPGKVASFVVDIASTNPDFIESLGLANVPETFDLCQIAPTHPAFTLLSAFGFPLGDALRNATEKNFDIGGAMPLLYNRPGFDGEHTFGFRITDAEGQTVEASLVLVVDRGSESGAPNIVWKGQYVDGTDYDIDREEPYELDPNMQIDIEFTAPAGIRSLVVTIISETLDVTDVGLPQSFDLADIQDPDLAKTLGAPDGFGFPINDQVKNQTLVPFCITPFVELLTIFEGVHEFKLDLTDNAGTTITKSVKIHVTR